MTTKINQDRLEGVVQRNSPNVGGRMRPRAAVIHYTAGALPGPAINTFMNAKAKVSAHLVIDRSGGITQLADFTRVTWHAGVSELPGYSTGCNRFAIGIELVNRGWIDNTPVLAEQAEWTQVGARWWHVYPEAQLVALDGVLAALWSCYDLQVLTGHEYVAPGRKVDPGPAFPWSRYMRIYPTYLDKPGNPE